MQKVYDPKVARYLLVSACLAITIAAFESLAITTVMPTIVKDLGLVFLYPLSFGIPLALQLVTTAFAGPWCDSRGPKPSLFTGFWPLL